MVTQALESTRLIPGGLSTAALVAKYADHLPLYRQSQKMARQGIDIGRSTLAKWVGFAANELAPLHERRVAILTASANPVRRRDPLPGARSRTRQD